MQGADELRQALAEFSERRLRSATATALTRTARQFAADWSRQLAQRLDRPTPATLRSVVVKRAENTDAQPTAEVRIRDQARMERGTPPVQWLAEQEMGGRRGVKKFEAALQAQGAMPRGWAAVPGPAAKLDSYGNVTRGQIVQVIAQLGAQFSPGYQRVISQSAAKRAASAIRRGRAYVAIQAGNKAGLTPGVYERDGRGLRAVFYFVRHAAYRKRLDLVGAASRDALAVLQREFARAVSESAARLAQRRE